MKEEKIKHTISATSFSTYERCPLQYYYKYILELLEPQSDALETGNKVHKFIEDYNN
jgi:ATP-dependent helicase/DNAse subunit B